MVTSCKFPTVFSYSIMKIAFLICCLALLLDAPLVRAELLVQPNDRLAICGDGMTNGLGYSVYVEDYLLMNQPIAGLDVAQFGWSAGDPAGFLARMNTDLLPFRPTVVLTSFNSGDVATREKAQTDLVEALKKAGVRTIVIGSPVCVDSATFQNDPAKAAAENKNRAALAAIDRGVAAKEGVVYADVYGATTSMMQKEKALRGESYDMQSDGDVFNMSIAVAYLTALGCDGALGTITFDYATGKAEGTPGQKIVSVQDKTVAISSTIPAFWFPAHNISPDAPRPDPLLKCIPFNEELNRYMLVVKNLPEGQAKVYWDDRTRDFSSEELARGVNLAETMGGDHPFGNITNFVDGGVRGQQNLEAMAGALQVQGKPDPQAEAKRQAALQVAKSHLVPVNYNIAIQPLAEPEKWPPGPIPVIIDTDLDGDVDDVGALAILDDFMDQGEATLIACVHNTSNAQLSSCAAIQAINAYYGHPSIPIGQAYGDKGPATPMTSKLLPAPADAYHAPGGPFGSSYTLQLHQKFDPDFPNDDKMPAGVDVYRKVLASAADGTVVICSVGEMINIQDLIQSQPDSVSPLSGLDLVRKKVRELVIMANTMPQDHYLLSKWPTKIMWTTYVGNGIGTGPSLLNTPENNPVRVAFDLFGVLHNGRQSWDETAAWVAVRGPGDVFDVVAGRPQFINDITKTEKAPHPDECELTFKMTGDQAGKVIGEEMARAPKY
jgi:hypothetical protein